MSTFEPNEIEFSTSIFDSNVGDSSYTVRSVTPVPAEICSDHSLQLMHYPINNETYSHEYLKIPRSAAVSAIDSSERHTLSLSPTFNIDESRSSLLLSDGSITGDSPHHIHEACDVEEYDTTELSIWYASDDETIGDLDLDTTSLMEMSLEDITALEQSLARELMKTQTCMNDVGKMIKKFETN